MGGRSRLHFQAFLFMAMSARINHGLLICNNTDLLSDNSIGADSGHFEVNEGDSIILACESTQPFDKCVLQLGISKPTSCEFLWKSYDEGEDNWANRCLGTFAS